jgi:peptide/nickel transport system permease protein
VSYALRRILATFPLLLAVSFVVFALLDLLPGDPAARRFDLHANPEAVKAWRAERGLDDPFLVRWGRYVAGVLTRFDFGKSYARDDPVGADLGRKLQATLELSICALLLAVAVGVSVGILSAVFPRSPIDYFGSLLALGGISLPVFWLGMLLWVFVADVLGLAYRSGRAEAPGFATELVLFEALFRLRLDVFAEQLRRILLPALTLATIPMAVVTRMTRAAMLDELGKDYATTARAKGLSEPRVVLRHVLRNALIPITTVTGLQFGHLLGGAVLTETVFSWPGLGSYIVKEGVQGSDTPVVVAGILLVATLFILLNLVVDLLYAAIDPRLRRGG